MSDREESLHEVEQAVEDGVQDTEFNAHYPGGVLLKVDGGYTCSGTLISPTWVITAAHCVDADDRSTKDWTVVVSPYGQHTDNGAMTSPISLTYPKERVGSDPPLRHGRTYRHTFATSGVIPFLDAPSWPLRERDTDIALIKLDERVPHPVGVPARLPAVGECASMTEGSLFSGRLVGYAPGGFDGEGWSCDGEEPSGWRRRRGPGFIGWEREDGPDASMFTHLFRGSITNACGTMDGMGTGGDSGGGLFKQGAGPRPLLCGVVSGDGPENDGTSGTTVYSQYYTSALDDGFNRGWLISAGAQDIDGFLDDTYEPRNNDGGNDDDDDDDGIADLYDNCPNVANPQQLDTFDDPDFDGVGAACEECVGVNESYGPNANAEVEGIFGVSPKADACDPIPVPVFTLDEQGDLPATAGVTSNPPADYCGPLGCELSIRNTISVDGRAGAGMPPSFNATVGVRFCDCSEAPGSPNSATPAGRTICRSQGLKPCIYGRAKYQPGPTSNWLPIRTPSTNSWTNPVDGREWTQSVAADFATFWDFTALGAPIVTHTNHNFFRVGSKVHGVLWVTNRALSPMPSTFTVAELQDRGATLGSGDARWRWVPKAPPQFKWSQDTTFCPECPQGLQHPYYEVGYPDWRANFESKSLPYPAPTGDTLTHYEDVAAGTVRHVSASEPLHALARTLPPGQTVIRSLGMSGEAVTGVLRASSLSELPVREPFSSASTGPIAAASRGYAFSATKQRLYVLGGTTTTAFAVVPKNEGWLLDLASNSWRQFTFGAGESVGAVLAMTYRWQDQAIYFLDQSGTTLRLRRWNAQDGLAVGAIQTLATFPSTWNGFSKRDLVNTPDGNLLLVARDGTATEKMRIGFISVSPARRVTLPRVAKSTSIPLLGAPAAGPTGYTMLRTNPTATNPAWQKPYGTTVLYTSMPATGTPDAPTIVAH